MQDDGDSKAAPRRIATTLRYREDVKEIMQRRARAAGRTLTNYIESLVLADEARSAAAPPARGRGTRA